METAKEEINRYICFYNRHKRRNLPLLKEEPKIISRESKPYGIDIDYIENGNVWHITVFVSKTDGRLWDIHIDSIDDYEACYGKELTRVMWGYTVEEAIKEI